VCNVTGIHQRRLLPPILLLERLPGQVGWLKLDSKGCLLRNECFRVDPWRVMLHGRSRNQSKTRPCRRSVPFQYSRPFAREPCLALEYVLAVQPCAKQMYDESLKLRESRTYTAIKFSSRASRSSTSPSAVASMYSLNSLLVRSR
jgi:hypothetical protein